MFPLCLSKIIIYILFQNEGFSNTALITYYGCLTFPLDLHEIAVLYSTDHQFRSIISLTTTEGLFN